MKKEYDLQGNLRKNSIIMCQMMITSDNEFFKKIGLEETKRYFRESYKFVCNYKNLVGRNIISAAVHLDETTPHMHQQCMSAELQEMGEKYYQYTAIDEYSRLRYTWFTNAHDTYASSEFVRRLVKYFPFKVETIQTDNGFEFTNRLSWQAFMKNKKTMFEKTIEELGIEYKVIRPHTPKQNGRVERSHRKDQERFYYKRVFYSLEDLRNQGKEYNNFPMMPLGWLSPREFIKKYKSQEESLFAIQVLKVFILNNL